MEQLKSILDGVDIYDNMINMSSLASYNILDKTLEKLVSISMIQFECYIQYGSLSAIPVDFKRPTNITCKRIINITIDSLIELIKYIVSHDLILKLVQGEVVEGSRLGETVTLTFTNGTNKRFSEKHGMLYTFHEFINDYGFNF